MKLMFCMLINMEVFCKLTVLFLMGLARFAQITQLKLQYLCEILGKKSGSYELTGLAGSNTSLTINYTSNVLPPLTLFFSECGIHTKRFLHLFNHLCSISSLLFQVTLGPCKLACC